MYAFLNRLFRFTLYLALLLGVGLLAAPHVQGTTLPVLAAGDTAVSAPAVFPARSAIGEQAVTIHLTDAGFNPDLLFITVNTAVTWQNDTAQTIILVGDVTNDFQSQWRVFLPLIMGGSGHHAAAAISGDAPPLFEATIPPGGNYTYTFTTPGIYDYYRLDNPDIQGRIIVEPEAGENEAEPSPIYDNTTGIYTGPGAIQQGMDPAIIEFERVAVIHGYVFDRDWQPLAGVHISLLHRPEFGYSTSRADGSFDLVFNGGGPVVLEYRLDGYLPAQRALPQTQWQTVIPAEAVILSELDTAATPVNLPAITNMQAARGTAQTDEDGSRQATLLFPANTTATMTLPDGSSQPLTQLTVRATEYTVGGVGMAAMPGTLPAASGYTYAVEFSVDEALAQAATRVDFSQPIINYTENFIEAPVGSPVPTAAYDREQALWVPGPDGLVMAIVGEQGNEAQLDADGDGDSDSDDTVILAGLGVASAELTQLASLYDSGQELWRVAVTHFTPFDHNWPAGPPPGSAPPPNNPLPPNEPNSCSRPGSIIRCESQILGETAPLAGTPYYLAYSSDRQPGWLVDRDITVRLLDGPVPDGGLYGLRHIALEIEIAGHHYEWLWEHPNLGDPTVPDMTPNLSHTFHWDGLDAFGNPVVGEAVALIRIGYGYYPFYYSPYDGGGSSFGQYSTRQQSWLGRVECAAPGGGSTSGNGGTVVCIPYRQRAYQQTVRLWDARALLGMGGWHFNIQHFYDPAGRTLYLGDGTSISTEELGDSALTTLYEQAVVDYLSDMAVGPDGSLYTLDKGNGGLAVHKQSPEGMITLIGGNGQAGNPTGDGGPASQATLGYSGWGIDVGPDGAVYITVLGLNGHGHVRKIAPDGIITTIAGSYDWSGDLIFSDGHPATQTHLSWLQAVKVGPDGLVYFADYGNLIIFDPDIAPRIRRINANGMIETVAGGNIGSLGDEDLAGVPALSAILGRPYGLAFGPDGSLYFADYAKHTVNRVTPDGLLTRVAGDRMAETNGDGGAAITASIGQPTNVAVSLDGTVYIRQDDLSLSVIRRVTPDGIITTYAGKLVGCGTAVSLEYEPLRQSCLEGNSHGLVLAADGLLHFSDGRAQLRRALPALPTFAADHYLLPATNGQELYEFSPRGRHLNTYDTLTGTLITHFTYDGNGRLIAITDRDGNLTQIERDSGGRPTALIAPWGQRTELALNGDGYLTAVTNPAQETFTFAYHDEGGLLASYNRPRGGVSQFVYDEDGRLVRDEGPDNLVQMLAQVQTTDTLTVTVTTGLGVQDSYVTHILAAGGRERRLTSADGGTTLVQIGPDKTTTILRPDGTQLSLTAGPDPRWGMRAPLASATTLLTAGGRQMKATTAANVTLADPLNPMSVVTWAETTTLTDPATGQYQQWLTRYDRDSHTLTLSSPVGREQIATLDARGRIILIVREGYQPIAYRYNARGQVAQLTEGSGGNVRVTTYAYTPDGRLHSITDPLGRVTTYSYDAAGRLLSQTLPGNRTIAFAYDADGNRIGVTPPGRPQHTFAYDLNGMPTTYTPPGLGAGNWQLQTSFDNDRRLSQITWPDGQQATLAYDPFTGHKTTMTLPGTVIGYTYDPANGHLTNLTRQGGADLSFAYDGNLVTQVTTQGPFNGAVALDYDNFMRLQSWEVGGTGVTYQYDRDNLVTQAGALSLTRHPLTGLVTATNLGTVAETRSFNTFGELTGITVRQGTPTVFSANYSYDALSRLTSKTETINGTATTTGYSYDAAGRLASVQQNGATIAAYTYDANGNRMTAQENGSTRTATYNAQDQLVSVDNTSYSYTRDGRLQSKSNGGQTTTYAYDLAGNLTQVTLPDTTQIAYIADGFNRRVTRLVNGAPVQSFLYLNKLNPIAELDSNGNVVSLFVYGSRTNTPDYIVRDGITYRLISDRLGSPRLVINTTTGEIMQRLEYDAWGRVLFDSNPGFQPFGFAGGLYDPATSLVRFGARDYDPEVGRWTAKDPLLFDGGQANLYAYAQNDPVNWLDPSGLEGEPTWGQRLTNWGEQMHSGAKAWLKDKLGEYLCLGPVCASPESPELKMGGDVGIEVGEENVASLTGECSVGLTEGVVEQGKPLFSFGFELGLEIPALSGWPIVGGFFSKPVFTYQTEFGTVENYSGLSIGVKRANQLAEGTYGPP